MNGVRLAASFVPVVVAFSASYSVVRTVAPRAAGAISPASVMASMPTSAPALALCRPIVFMPVRSGSGTVNVAQPEVAGSAMLPARAVLI